MWVEKWNVGLKWVNIHIKLYYIKNINIHINFGQRLHFLSFIVIDNF